MSPEDTPNDNAGGGKDVNIHICSNWGMTKGQVKAEMNGYSLDNETDDNLYFSANNTSHIVSYEFYDGELCAALVMAAEDMVSDSSILKFVSGYTEVGYIDDRMVYLNENKNTVATYNTETDNKINYKTLGLTQLDLDASQNIFYYTTTNNRVLTPNISAPFDVKILSNTYNGGIGMIVCDGDITHINKSAFDGCRTLKSITIPDSVTSIGENAFQSCEELTSVVLPNGITTIQDYTFDYCLNLANITIPDSVTSIGEYAFRYCASLTTVTIPESVTSIGYKAFRSCTKLTSINIPKCITKIENLVFAGCYSLTSITIPDDVTSIGWSAFWECI